MALLHSSTTSATIPKSLESNLDRANLKTEHLSPHLNLKDCIYEQFSYSFAGSKDSINKASLNKRSDFFKLCAVSSGNSVQIENRVSKIDNDADRPSAAQLSRTLMEVCTEGTLSSIGTDSWPIGTSVKFSVDAEGSPIFQLAPQSLHATHFLNDNRCSLHVNITLPGDKKPQCTLKGKIIPAEDDITALKTQISWKKRFGESESETSDDQNKPTFFIMQVEQILTWTNFGQTEVIVSSKDYLSSKPDPLRNSAFRIVEDMNREHYDDIKRFCYVFADIDEDVEDASLTWVDEIGFNMKVLIRDTQEIKDVRITFPRVVTDDRDARSSIMMMAQIAWEKERNYIPPEIPFLGHQSIA